MKDKKQSIELSIIDHSGIRERDLSAYCYHLIGLVEYKPIFGQGDIEHRWVYLCRKAGQGPVLITEAYDISWGDGPYPQNVSRRNLYELTEEKLTEKEFLRYKKLATPVGEGTISLPITLNLPEPPVL